MLRSECTQHVSILSDVIELQGGNSSSKCCCSSDTSFSKVGHRHMNRDVNHLQSAIISRNIQGYQGTRAEGVPTIPPRPSTRLYVRLAQYHRLLAEYERLLAEQSRTLWAISLTLIQPYLVGGEEKTAQQQAGVEELKDRYIDSCFLTLARL